jgi:phosphopantothenoylcysteine decarboxylase/phosphopantothenate--cysteine ligase
MARELLYAVICRGGEVEGVFGQTSVALPAEVNVTSVRTSSEMLKELKKRFKWCDCLIMAAAIGDYKPKKKSQTKIHTPSLNVQLGKTIDLLAELNKTKKEQVMVGFSLAGKDQVRQGKQKLTKKGLDCIILNEPSTLGSDHIKARIMNKSGRITKVATASKWHLANRILDQCIDIMKRRK